MSAPRMDPRQVIYAPVQQQRNYSDQRILQYPFVQTIQSIANSVGPLCQFRVDCGCRQQASLDLCEDFQFSGLFA